MDLIINGQIFLINVEASRKYPISIGIDIDRYIDMIKNII